MGGGGGKLFPCPGVSDAGSLLLTSVGACVTRLGGGMAPPADTGGPNLLLLGADDDPLTVSAAPESPPFLAQGILPTMLLEFFLAAGAGSGVFLVPMPQDILMLDLFSGRGCS